MNEVNVQLITYFMQLLVLILNHCFILCSCALTK